MSDTAVHLEQEVLPEVPVRHWVCTWPWGVRAVLGFDRGLCREATRVFIGELSRSLRHRAKQLLGLESIKHALTGAIAVVQRTDGALRLNVHLHVLALDGVYLRDESGGLEFHALPTPSRAEVEEVARRTAKRLHRVFQKVGRLSPWDEPELSEDEHPFTIEQPGLFACYQAAALGVGVTGERAGQPTLRLLAGEGKAGTANDTEVREEPVAEALGVDVYAKQLVDGRDRAQLERLCRYVMRPPLSQERLEWRSDGRLLLTLKNIWRDGTRALVLEPFDLVARLCAAIPPPGFHLVRYFGVLSSHSSDRHLVVPKRAEPERFVAEPASGDQLALGFDDAGRDDALRATRRSRWGWLLRHVFRADVEKCSRCGGPMRWVEAATKKDAIGRLLAKHGLAPRPPPESVLTPVGQLPLPFR